MPKNPVFDQARGRATPELVESLFSAPDARWDGDEFWTRNPLRGDGSAGSFSINGLTGLWSDFASGDKGDLIGLIVESGKAPTKVAAAEMIVRALGGTVDAPAGGAPSKSHLDKPAKAKRPKAVIPAPESALDLMRQTVKGDYAQRTHGNATAGYTYRNAESGIVFCVSRFQKPDGSKDIVPYFFGEDGRWHEGQALDSGRPVLFLDIITKAAQGTKVLIVEGEKCAKVEVPGYILTTWAGGALATSKTDWAPLERFAARGDLVIWPDADEPGLKAGIAIVKRLPGAKLLDIRGQEKGWDIADASAQAIALPDFIASCPLVAIGSPPVGSSKPDARPDDGLPFLCLGYDKAAYYFLPNETRTVFSIPMGSFNASKLGELASLSFWGLRMLVTDQGSIKVAPAQDFLLTLQHKTGFFDPKRIRGAGVWRDHTGIVLNDGHRIVTIDGTAYEYGEYRSNYWYIPSLVAFGEMAGPASTDEDGEQLEELFRALEFTEDSAAILLMGWCLLSPFGGVLTWRPHVWLTGQKGSGKSWVFENIVVRLAGPFAYIGSGKDTEAGIRWALDQDARPAVMAEMEPKTKTAREKIASILELARNASDDGSGNINISQSGGGTKSFRIRSMFAFSSKVIPVEDDSVSSRITRLELAKSKDEPAKIAKTVALLSDLLDDPSRFTRRIFRALPRIISDIEYLKETYLPAFRSKRAADQLAPMLATAWAARSGASIRTAGPWLDKWIVELSQESKVVQGDEDTFMHHLVGLGLRDDEGHTRTVAELLTRVSESTDTDSPALRLLERHGITLRRKGPSKPWLLSIATNLAVLADKFRDTPWGDAYGDQVKRCAFTVEGPTRQIRMAAGKPRCHDLDWEGFRDRYLGVEGQDEPALDLGGEDDIPF